MRISTLTLLLVACSGDDGQKDDGPTTPADRFAEFINSTTEVSGDFACFTPAADLESSTFLTQAIDPSRTGDFPINGIVLDFEEEDMPVANANVALFTSDIVTGSPEQASVSDVNGNTTITGPACDPVTYRVTTVGGPIATKTTFKAHQVYPFPSGPSIEGAEFLSVSDVTYQLIPGILGIDVLPELAIIAGTAFDCSRDPTQTDDAGKVEGVQVIVYDANGDIPDTLSVNYFVESFPARDQKSTSADGLWVAANVPPGELRAEMWGVVGGELVLLGATELSSEADSINISNIFSGYGDGVKYPTSCELP